VFRFDSDYYCPSSVASNGTIHSDAKSTWYQEPI
jgi:hypothetical protein